MREIRGADLGKIVGHIGGQVYYYRKHWKGLHHVFRNGHDIEYYN